MNRKQMNNKILRIKIYNIHKIKLNQILFINKFKKNVSHNYKILQIDVKILQIAII